MALPFSITHRAPARRAVLAMTGLGLASLLIGCSARPDDTAPPLSAYETAQRDRCVALMTPMLRGEPVRSTAVERGPHGLDYVWINAEVHDDADDLDRRIAAGASIGGHCQFEHGDEAVHVHAYALDAGDTTRADATADYRYVAGSRDTVASADAP